MYAFRDDIKNYIDKNWGELKDSKNKFDYDILNKGKKVYKKNCNINNRLKKKILNLINKSDFKAI